LEIVQYITDNDGNIITLKSDIEEATPKTKYVYYDKDSLLSAISKKDLVILKEVKDNPDYINYPPVYYDNAEKIRSLQLKESNYFNGLSSLSETF
jgi:hypothetical protein